MKVQHQQGSETKIQFCSVVGSDSEPEFIHMGPGQSQGPFHITRISEPKPQSTVQFTECPPGHYNWSSKPFYCDGKAYQKGQWDCGIHEPTSATQDIMNIILFRIVYIAMYMATTAFWVCLIWKLQLYF